MLIRTAMTGFAALMLVHAQAPAASLSISPTAPTVDGSDIAYLAGNQNIGGDTGHIWADRPVHGQTFTTADDGPGYWLHSVTMKSLSDVPDSGAFTVRVGTVTGNTFSSIGTATTAAGAAYSGGDYLTVNFDNPISLSGGTLYGFDWTSSGSGFVTANSSAGQNPYVGGTAFSSGDNSVPDDSNLVFHDADRTFHLDLQARVSTPVLAYRFDDAAGNLVPNHGTLGAVGDATMATGTTTGGGSSQFTGGSLTIDTSNDQMATGDLSNQYDQNGFSVSFWINPTSTSDSWKELMGDVNAGPPNGTRGWNLQAMTDGVIAFRTWKDGGMATVNSDANLLVAGEWQHITVVADGLTETGTRDVVISFYRNGELFTTHTLTDVTATMLPGTEGFKVGDTQWDQSAFAQFGQVMLFDDVLTADQVSQLPTYSVPEPAGLLAMLVGLGIVGLRRN